MLLSTAERWVFTYGLQVTSWFYANGIVSTNNSADYAFFVCFVRPVRPRFLRLSKVRRQSHPCIYYANTVSTFQPLLEGDLVFKLTRDLTKAIKYLHDQQMAEAVDREQSDRHVTVTISLGSIDQMVFLC